MTIDDENSVYVGGLPYDATEDSIRRVFDLYGQIVAVKINNDHEIGGKCYGFVTFTNPRSAVDAIKDMDGRSIGGRVVKVNEVKTRGMKSNFGRDSFRRSSEQVTDLGRGRGRGRERERNYDYDRDRSRDRNSERSRDHEQDRERGYDHARELDRTRNRFIDRERGHDQDRDMDDHAYERERNHGLDLGNDLSLDQDQDHDRELRRTKNRQRSGNKDKDQTSKFVNRSSFDDRLSKEHPSGSSQGDYNQVEEQVDFANQKLAELEKEISDMTELAEERGHHISKLQEKSLKLEDTLTAAKKLTSYRQKQLMKLHKCFVTMKECSRRLKSSEQELESLVESTSTELAYGNDGDVEGIHTNGET